MKDKNNGFFTLSDTARKVHKTHSITRRMSRVVVAGAMALALGYPMQAQRVQQPLGRGVVAVYGSSNGSGAVEITWRRLAQEPEDVRYNIYVSQTADGGYTQLNNSPVGNTNYSTTLSKVPYGSYVAIGVEGKEELSKPFLFKNNGLRNVFVEISYDKSPLDKTKYTTKFVWPCDLNGDGEYDYVVDRCPTDGTRNYYVEGYLADGTFLWNVDLGVNEKPCDGQNDNMCAYDIDCDGYGELIVQTSDGTRFWDAQAGTWGKYLFGKDNGDSDGDGIIDYDTQSTKNPPRYMSVVDGMTGAEKASAEFMYDDAYNRTNKASLMGDEYNKHEAHIGVAYLDGVHPSIVGEWLSRRASDKVHMYRNCAFGYVGGVWQQLFKENIGGAEFHSIRIFDADGDGKDEMSSGAYVMDDNGSTLYNTGISHGDRHRTSDIDPERPGLETFSIQQNAPDMLGMILFDASNGEPIKKWYLPSVGDVGRGECMDLDATHLGWEMFSTMDSYQIYDAKGNKIEGMTGFFPTEGLWWDGALDRERVDTPDGNGYNAMIVDYNNGRLIEMAKESGWTLKTSYGKRGKYWGDIIGDWREELVLIRERDGVCDGIVGFTTDYSTAVNNIYCLQEDPHYRMDCTTRGYYQSANPGFYLGYDMPRPPLPPCMVADDETDVFGITDGNSTIVPRDDVKRVYAMPVKGQTLTLQSSVAGAEGADTELWKGGQGTLVMEQAHAGNVYITEGSVRGTSFFGVVNLRARGTLVGATFVDSISCEGALNYEGCRLMPEGCMSVQKINLPKGKNLYVELTAGRDHLSLDATQGAGIKGSVIFTIQGDPEAGRYLLVDGGNLSTSQCQIRGLNGRSYSIVAQETQTESGTTQQLMLVIDDKREAADVVWTGAESAVWDYKAKNFLLDGEATNFVEGDNVTFNDDATRTTITLNDMMPAATATFAATTKSYTLNGSGGITGKTILRSGKVTVKELNYNFEIGKAQLVINNTNASCETAMLLTDTATIGTITNAIVALKGKITGSGTLLKTGSGQLNITYAGANAWKETILQNGTLAMGAWNTTFGNATSPIHVTGNAAITVFNNNSTSQVPSFQNVVTIDSGKTLTFHAGQRCSIKGTLKGEGTYKIDFPYVRGDVSTNCAQFEGTYHVTTTNCRFVQAMNLSKATLKIDNGAEVVSVSAGSSTAQNYTHKVGTLMGTGTLGNGVWNVGKVVSETDAITVNGTMNLSSATIDVTKRVKSNISENTELKVFAINGKVNVTGNLSITPAQPKAGLKWDTSTLATDGILRVANDPDGIGQVDATPTDNDDVYDLMGRQVKHPQKGIFIKGGHKVVKTH